VLVAQQIYRRLLDLALKRFAVIDRDEGRREKRHSAETASEALSMELVAFDAEPSVSPRDRDVTTVTLSDGLLLKVKLAIKPTILLVDIHIGRCRWAAGAQKSLAARHDTLETKRMELLITDYSAFVRDLLAACEAWRESALLNMRIAEVFVAKDYSLAVHEKRHLVQWRSVSVL